MGAGRPAGRRRVARRNRIEIPEVFVHCRTGHQASRIFFVLRRLPGYRMSEGATPAGPMPQTGDKGIYLKQQLKDKLIEHRQYIENTAKNCRRFVIGNRT